MGVIAAVASFLTGLLRWESIPVALAIALCAALVSVAIVWLVDRARRA